MPALTTHTLDEELEILLIAESSQLSQTLVEKIDDLSDVSAELVEIKNLDGGAGNLDKDWYKVYLLLKHPFIRDFSIEKIPEFLWNKLVVIMPLTTAINPSSELAGGWIEQVESEKNIFKKLNKKVDASPFIFYQDLLKEGTEPFSFFLSQLQQSLLADPGIELGFQTAEGLTSHLATSLFKTSNRTKLIRGKIRSSKVFLQKTKDLYQQHRQVSFPIKQVLLRAEEHSVLKEIGAEVVVEEVPNSIDDVAQAVARAIPNLSAGGSSRGCLSKSIIQPPRKLELIKVWNQTKDSLVEVKQQRERKIAQKKETQESISSSPPSPSINSVFEEYREQQKEDHLKRLTTKTKLGFHKIKRRKLLFVGGALTSLLALGALGFVAILMINISGAKTKLVAYLESRSLPITAQQKKLLELETTVGRLESQFAVTSKWLPALFFSQANQVVEVSQHMIELVDQVDRLEKTTGIFYQRIMAQEAGDVFEYLELVNIQSGEVFKTLSLLQAELKSFSMDDLNPEEKELLVQYQELILDQEKSLSQFQQLSPLLSSLLGDKERQVYAIVLQNNQELRPTGGFIQAVALLTFEQGKLINIQVEDVYGIDQQLKGVIKPPEDLQRFLGEERWFLRDGNWNPDFPQTASQINWFIDQSLGVKVDGVIGVNLEVLESVVGVLERLEIDEYNEVITQRNLSERMEFHSEVQLVDTAQNRDYAELILFEVLDKLQALPGERVIPLLSSLISSIEHKEMLVTVFNNDIQSTFETLGWTGSLVDPACPSVFQESECIVDSIAQVEANVGVNKANYYLDRQIDHSITLLANEAIHKRVISFKNKAQTNAWPKGSYKAYVRFYLPEQSELASLKLGGQEIPHEELILKREAGKNLVGALVEVAVKSEVKLQLEYSLPYNQQTPFTYVFFDQKQAGARNVSPRVFIKHAPDLSPTLIAPQAEVQGGVIVFNPSKDSGHLFVGATFE
jgi:hypothetical protein